MIKALYKGRLCNLQDFFQFTILGTAGESFQSVALLILHISDFLGKYHLPSC